MYLLVDCSTTFPLTVQISILVLFINKYIFGATVKNKIKYAAKEPVKFRLSPLKGPVTIALLGKNLNKINAGTIGQINQAATYNKLVVVLSICFILINGGL